jgi:hypothetical protein
VVADHPRRRIRGSLHRPVELWYLEVDALSPVELQIVCEEIMKEKNKKKIENKNDLHANTQLLNDGKIAMNIF